MSENTNTLSDSDELQRFTRIAQDAADAAFRVRVRNAVTLRIDQLGSDEMIRIRREAGIDVHRWIALRRSTRNASSPEEFQVFAGVLGVSARWLAIGMGTPAVFEHPPAGWETFGSHVDRPDVELEFSTRVGPEDGLPLWERPRLLAAASTA